nr:hypothetical protein [Tanacetum cinerariifolium]
MRELVVKYKAEKVCHEEMVKMPLVDLNVLESPNEGDKIPKTAFRMHYRRFEFTAMPFWVDQCTSDFHGRNESDEFRAAEEREVSCEAQQGRSRVKRKLFGSCRNNMGNEPILAVPEGSDNFVVMHKASVRMRDVRTLIMKEAHATKYSVRPGSERTFRTLENMFRACMRNLVVVGILTFREGEIGESKMIGLELEQETTKFLFDELRDEDMNHVVTQLKVLEEFP